MSAVRSTIAAVVVVLAAVGGNARAESGAETAPERSAVSDDGEPAGAAQSEPAPGDAAAEAVAVPEGTDEPDVSASPATPNEEEDGLSVTGFPIVGYTPETHWAFAGLVFLSYPSHAGDEFGSAQVYGTYTTRKQWSVGVQWSHYTQGDRWLIESDFTFSDWIQDFYGVGSSTVRERRFIYNELTFSAELGALRMVRELPLRVGFDLKVGWRHQKDFDDLREAEERLPGTERSPIGWVGPRLRWDSRDIEFAPTSGHFFEAAAQLSPGSGPGRRTWAATYMDYRGFFDLGNTHIIAIRGRVEAASQETPLANLPNTDELRGPPDLRGVNTRTVVAQLEYRTPYVWHFSFVAMTGVGAGWGAYDATGCCSPHASLGGGVRLALQRDRRVNLSADFAWSGYETNFYLGIGETF